MPTLRELLAGLSNEELEALKQEFIKAQASGGEIASEQGRGLLKANMPSRFGRAALAGIQAGGQSVVSDVREMAGFSPTVREGLPISREWKPTTKEEALQLEREKRGIAGEAKISEAKPFAITEGFDIPEGYEISGYDQKGNPMIRKIEQKGLSPNLENAKQKRTEDLITTVEQNKVAKDMITQAKEAATKIDTGLMGKGSMWWKKNFAPNDPMLAEWQKVKMVLTDAQLMNTAKTKGAISDAEMALFSKAAANDDIASVQAMQPVFDKLLRFIDAEEKSKKDTYKQIYKEDPSEFLGGKTTSSENNDPLGIR